MADDYAEFDTEGSAQDWREVTGMWRFLLFLFCYLIVNLGVLFTFHHVKRETLTCAPESKRRRLELSTRWNNRLAACCPWDILVYEATQRTNHSNSSPDRGWFWALQLLPKRYSTFRTYFQ